MYTTVHVATCRLFRSHCTNATCTRVYTVFRSVVVHKCIGTVQAGLKITARRDVYSSYSKQKVKNGALGANK